MSDRRERYEEQIRRFEELVRLGAPRFLEVDYPRGVEGKKYIPLFGAPYTHISLDKYDNIYITVPDTDGDGDEVFSPSSEDEHWNGEYLELMSATTFMQAKIEADYARKNLAIMDS